MKSVSLEPSSPGSGAPSAGISPAAAAPGGAASRSQERRLGAEKGGELLDLRRECVGPNGRCQSPQRHRLAPVRSNRIIFPRESWPTQSSCEPTGRQRTNGAQRACRGVALSSVARETRFEVSTGSTPGRTHETYLSRKSGPWVAVWERAAARAGNLALSNDVHGALCLTKAFHLSVIIHPYLEVWGASRRSAVAGGNKGRSDGSRS